MNLGTTFRTLGRNDLRLVRRDQFLIFMVGYVLIIAVVLRYAIPWLHSLLQAEMGFDLTPYYPLVASWLMVVIGPQIAGTVFGFLILDEQDANTLRAMMVTPLPLNRFLLYRIVVATLFGVAMAVMAVLIIDLVELPVWQLTAISSVAALYAPVLMLFYAAVADNKVEGFALLKIAGLAGLVPLLAWFIPEPWQYLAGLFPPYWSSKALWSASAGSAAWPVYLAAGILTSVAAVWWLARRFETEAYQ